MDYPKTDEDWEKLAECIVMKQTGVLPEAIGSLTVEATATIFSWYRGEERSNALSKRADARHDLIKYGKRAGCLEEREEIKLGERMIEVPLGRPVPQTYGDWVNLAEDIKDKVDTPEYAEINHHLCVIQGITEGDAEYSKRWLTRIAGELGIK